MLIEFRVKNFRSIKDEAVLSMVASTDTETLPQNLIEPIKGFKHRLLKSAALYGANASGKSNVIKAMLFMTEFVENSDRLEMDDPIPVTPFLFDEASSGNKSFFESNFLYENIRYVYGFELDKTTIHAEWLYYYPNGKRTRIFERKNDDKGKIKFQANISVVKKEEWGFIEKYISNNPKSLITTFSAKIKCSPIDNAYAYIVGLVTCFFDKYIPALELVYSRLFLEQPDVVNKLISVLKTADFDIANIETKKKKIDPDEAKNIAKGFEKASFIDEDIKPEAIKYFSSDRIITYFVHNCRMASGSSGKCAIELDEESEGTKKMFLIVLFILSAIDAGQTVIMDEFDLKLHPMLVEYLVKYFHEESKNAQLIFTTHNTELLYPNIFRRDQIWFTQKKRDSNSTEMYSLHDFKTKSVRKEENFRKNYLDGRYGAIPIINRFDV